MATNGTFTPPTTSVGTVYYYCKITFPSLSGGCEVVNTNATLITVNENPVIANQNATICSGDSFTVTPNTTGGNIIPAGTIYTWTNPVINPAGSVTGASAQASPQNSISQTLINTTSTPATVTYTVTPKSGFVPVILLRLQLL